MPSTSLRPSICGRLVGWATYSTWITLKMEEESSSEMLAPIFQSAWQVPDERPLSALLGETGLWLQIFSNSYVHTHIHTYIHACIHNTHIHINTYIHIYQHCWEKLDSGFKYFQIHTYIHTYIHAYITHIYTYIHTYIHTHIHTYITHKYITTNLRRANPS